MPGTVQTILSMPFGGETPGTAGLRRAVRVFQQRHYLTIAKGRELTYRAEPSVIT
jgi:hypothetical protein